MNHIEDLRAQVRDARARYDALRRGETAVLRRSRTATDIALEPVFWRIGGALAQSRNAFSHVALHFPLAAQRRSQSLAFSFGRFLRGQLGDKDGPKLRMRRLLACRDRDELDHRLRAILRLACADGARVDWGVLGVDILWYFAESDTVRRRWAQDFYAPNLSDPAASPATTQGNQE